MVWFNIMHTTLPVFRIAGLHAPIRATHQEEDLNALWQQWHESSLKNDLPAFSTTVYCMRHEYQDNGDFSATIGQLIANDAELPDTAHDAWLPPQQYRVYTLPEKSHHAASAVWQQAQADDLPRQFRADFESYPVFGEARVYIGVVGDVVIEEEM